MINSYFEGQWVQISKGRKEAVLDISFDGQVCLTHYKNLISQQESRGIGLVFEKELYVASIDQEQYQNSIQGGICIYVEIPFTSTFYAYWSSFGIYNGVGSGFAIKQHPSPDFFEGNFTIQYYSAKTKTMGFELQIETAQLPGLAILKWFADGQRKLDGIGLKLNNHLALSWGVPGINWEIRKYSAYRDVELVCNGADLAGALISDEIFIRG